MSAPKHKLKYPPMSTIILSTLNAKYIHASLGLRYLYANMGELKEQTEMVEFTIDKRAADMAELLLERNPKIIGFGVYIWNIEETTRLVKTLKQVAPQVKIVIGGPEVTYEWEGTAIFEHADYLIRGHGDLAFAKLCESLLKGTAPIEKVLAPDTPTLDDIIMPYAEYSDDDLAHRLIYVEASRGCPFKCEFCLSSLDKTSYPFNLDAFLTHMDNLHQRGARHFKFVDRTFNLKVATSLRILEFFLERMSDDLFVHFEIIPDHLPDKLKAMIQRFPEGSLQFEVGVQSFDENVQTLISRKQNNQKTSDNLRWLKEQTAAHIHADLIFGLPGDSLAIFKQSFDRLVALHPHEIQVGILKRLKGSPIIRHTEAFDMVYAPEPPYNILKNNQVSFVEVQQLNRFARYWDMLANSGRFKHSLSWLLGDKPFDNFWNFSLWLFEQSGQTHKIALVKMFNWVYLYLEEQNSENHWLEMLEKDFEQSGTKGLPPWKKQKGALKASHGARSSRQKRHMS